MNARIKNMWKPATLGGVSRLKGLSILTPGYKYKGENQELTYLLYRFPHLEIYSRYMENTQYEHLAPWRGDLTDQQNDDRVTQPKKVFPLPQIASDTFCGLITSQESRLNIIDQSTEKQKKIDEFLKKSMFWACLSSAFPSFFSNGSMFIRFYVSENREKILMEPINTKSCWPVFDVNNELEEVTIRYVYDTGEIDEKKDPIWNWAQYKIGKYEDIEYDNPRFIPDERMIPDFKIDLTIKHGLGFVQGEWFKNGFDVASDDGKSYIKNAMDYLDDLNYISSKESNALYHSLYPTLLGLGIDKDELEYLQGGMFRKDTEIAGGSSFISTEKPPKEADLRFLETTNAGIQLSEPYIQRNINIMQHILKITLPNPEVLLGYAQSAEAMKMLYRPIIEEVISMRPFLEAGVCSLLNKMEKACLSGGVPFAIPLGTIENAEKKWGEMITATETDKSQRTTNALQAVEGRIISRESATKHVAGDFGIENVSEEIKRIEKEVEIDEEKEMMNFRDQTKISAHFNPPKTQTPKPGGKK